MQLFTHIVHSQVSQQNFSAQARIAKILEASAGDGIGDERQDESAGTLRQGRGAYKKRSWADGPPPQAWQLADWAASLDVHNMLASAVEHRVIEHRGNDTRAALPSQTHTTDGKDVTAQEVASLTAADARYIAQATATLLEQALAQHIQHLRAAATTASAKAGAPSVHTNTNTLGVHIPGALTEPRNALDTHSSNFLLDARRFHHIGGGNRGARGGDGARGGGARGGGGGSRCSNHAA